MVTVTGDELKGFRLETELSQVKLASAMGIHWNTYARLERRDVVPAKFAIPALFVIAAWHAKKRDKLAPEFGRFLPSIVEML